MKGTYRIILAIACLALAALACNAVTGGGDPDTPVPPVNTLPVSNPTATAFSIPTFDLPDTGNVLFSDDFSSSRWGTGTDADSSVEYANGALQMIVYTQNYFVWSTPPPDNDYQNIHVEVTVLNNGTDSTTAFGVMCNKQGSSGNFYYLAMTPAGEYAIAKAAEGQKDVFLTNNDQWASSDLITKDAASYRVGADCSNGVLTLYVDGQQIASISDASYAGGGVAVFTWSGEEVNSADVSFDDFVVRQLP